MELGCNGHSPYAPEVLWPGGGGVGNEWLELSLGRRAWGKGVAAIDHVSYHLTPCNWQYIVLTFPKLSVLPIEINW